MLFCECFPDNGSYSLVYRGWMSEVLILKWYQVNQYTHI